MSQITTQSHKGPSRCPKSRPVTVARQVKRTMKAEAQVPGRIITILLTHHNKNNWRIPEVLLREKLIELLIKNEAVHSSLWATHAEREVILDRAFDELQAQGVLRYNGSTQTYRLTRSVLVDFYRKIDEQKVRESRAAKAAVHEGLSLKERAVQYQERRTS